MPNPIAESSNKVKSTSKRAIPRSFRLTFGLPSPNLSVHIGRLLLIVYAAVPYQSHYRAYHCLRVVATSTGTQEIDRQTHGLDAWGGRRIAGQNRLVCDRSNDPWQRYDIATLVVRRKYREVFEGAHSRIVCSVGYGTAAKQDVARDRQPPSVDRTRRWDPAVYHLLQFLAELSWQRNLGQWRPVHLVYLGALDRARAGSSRREIASGIH